jgi:alpha-galactosidase
MPATIAIIGAGSVVFTRDLLGDVFSFPELAESQVVLHDIDPERLDTAVAIAEATAREVGVEPTITAQ